MTQKVCVITGSRAEYGLLRWIMKEITESTKLELQIIVTGMHLSPEFGLTYRDIENDGFKINRKVEMLLSSDTASGVSKSMGLGLIGFGDAYNELTPDLLLVLGDRFEILSAVTAAMVSKIPVAHLHGGEITEGSYDDGFRHAITKMSHLHFVAAEEYRNRVIQMGENPENVYLTGGLGIDNIVKLKYLEKHELEKSLGICLNEKSLLITFHPVTLGSTSSSDQLLELLSALDNFSDTTLIFTHPNADTDGRELIKIIESFVASHENASVYTSLGQLRYLSCMKYVDGVVGNSSSGLLEAPSFGIGTVNIGERQKGRMLAKSVINCAAEEKEITAAIHRLYSSEFHEIVQHAENPYGKVGVSKKIVELLEKIPLENLIAKTFHDL